MTDREELLQRLRRYVANNNKVSDPVFNLEAKINLITRLAEVTGSDPRDQDPEDLVAWLKQLAVFTAQSVIDDLELTDG